MFLEKLVHELYYLGEFVVLSAGRTPDFRHRPYGG